MLKRKTSMVNKRRQRMMFVYLSRESHQKPQESTLLLVENGALIFKSELDYISRCILDRKNIETGGQLFGYWSEDGRPVIMYAIGPGPRANHQSTFFNQDVDYLVTIGKALKENFGLHHIGEWHSHHQLGLARPSSHDVNTMVSTIREKNLGKFLLCIGNCNTKASTLKAFLCDDQGCRTKDWDVIYADSPVRKEVDIRLNGILKHPLTSHPYHMDNDLNSSNETTPNYPEGYWLKEKGNGAVLNDIMNYLRRKHNRAEVKAQINQRGEVVLNIQDWYEDTKILFPVGFPYVAPHVEKWRYNRRVYSSNPENWNYMNNNIPGSFIHFYEFN